MEEQRNTTNEDFPGILDVAIILAMTLFLTVVAIGLGSLFKPSAEILLSELVIIVPAIFFVAARKLSMQSVFRLYLPSGTVILSTVLISLGTIILVDEIDRVVQMVFPMPVLLEEMFKNMSEILTINSISDGFIIMISAVIFAGLFEEMLFRGFVQQAVEKQLDVARGIIYSAIIFAFIHVNPWQLLQITILGLVLGYLGWKSNSIIPCIILHALNNGCAILFLNLGEDKINWYTKGDHVAPLVLIMAGITFYFGINLFHRSLAKNSRS